MSAGAWSLARLLSVIAVSMRPVGPISMVPGSVWASRRDRCCLGSWGWPIRGTGSRKRKQDSWARLCRRTEEPDEIIGVGQGEQTFIFVLALRHGSHSSCVFDHQHSLCSVSRCRWGVFEREPPVSPLSRKDKALALFRLPVPVVGQPRVGAIGEYRSGQESSTGHGDSRSCCLSCQRRSQLCPWRHHSR